MAMVTTAEGNEASMNWLEGGLFERSKLFSKQFSESSGQLVTQLVCQAVNQSVD